MAKKNSSKTATKEALQASEPRIQVFSGWQGMSVANASPEWQPRETGDYKFNQDDLKPNFLAIQNNLITADNLTIETRMGSHVIAAAPNGYRFTGVACVIGGSILAACESTGDGHTALFQFDGLGGTWATREITINDVDDHSQLPFTHEITEIGFYQKTIIVLTLSGEEGEIFTGDFSYSGSEMFVRIQNNTVKSEYYVPDPMTAAADEINQRTSGLELLKITAVGGLLGSNTPIEDHTGDVVRYVDKRIQIYITYTNKFGTTTDNDFYVAKYIDKGPAEFTSTAYLEISGKIATPRANIGVTGVDIYYSSGDSTDKIFIGHVDLPKNAIGPVAWSYNWYGSLSDTDQWIDNQMRNPTENTTKGVDATHFSCHDSKLFFWGNPTLPYRLYVGGKPGHELSIARGYGGAWVDIEPGSGYDVKGTAKWKTVQGANIITIMCGNHNTNRVKRFNLIETSTTWTNEVSSTSYMYEEVSNVVGCNSRWGYGVFGDGLYSISRYGLMLTTMAMEYNSQMRAQSVSDAVKPVFIDNLGIYLKDARMICIDDIIYIAFSDPNLGAALDQIILCYDLNLKAWYTFTHDEVIGEGEHILHMLPIDCDRYPEGIGIITKDYIRIYPTAGETFTAPPGFDVLFETGELSSRQPKQDTHYIQQLELRFDYFVGSCTVYIEGVDYYGRPFKVRKNINQTSFQRDWTEWIRIERYVESYRIRLEGKARFRLVSINAKAYTASKRIGLPYGYDVYSSHRRRPEDANMYFDHHPVDNYNNLRRAIIT